MKAAQEQVLERLMEERLIAVIRAESPEDALRAVEAIAAGGMTCMEITMTVPNGVEVLRSVAQGNERLLVGAGTVLTAGEVDACVDAGAQFVVSPGCCLDVVAQAIERDTLVIPGAMTPTEVITATRHGAPLVKVFPASRLGPQFLKDLGGPLPGVKFVPTGGITDANAAEYLRVGAAVLCIGSWLADPQAMRAGDYDRLTQRARQLVAVVNEEVRADAPG